jgi:hypothetical protein
VEEGNKVVAGKFGTPLTGGVLTLSSDYFFIIFCDVVYVRGEQGWGSFDLHV